MARTKQSGRKRTWDKSQKSIQFNDRTKAGEASEEALDSSISSFDISKVNSGPPDVKFRKKLQKTKSEDNTLDDALKSLTKYEMPMLEKIVNGHDMWIHDGFQIYKIEVIALSVLKRLQFETQKEDTHDSIHTMVVCQQKDTSDALLEKFNSYLHLVPGVKVQTLLKAKNKNPSSAEGDYDVLVGTNWDLEQLLNDGETEEKLKKVKHIITDILSPHDENKSNPDLVLSRALRDLLFTAENEQLVWWASQGVGFKKDDYLKPLMINPLDYSQNTVQQNRQIKAGYGSHFRKNLVHCAVKVDGDSKFQALFQLLHQNTDLKFLVITNDCNAKPVHEALHGAGIKSIVQEAGQLNFLDRRTSTENFKDWEAGVLVVSHFGPFPRVDIVFSYDYSRRKQLVNRYSKLSSFSRGFAIHFVCSEDQRRDLEGFEGFKLVSVKDMAALGDFYNGEYMEM